MKRFDFIVIGSGIAGLSFALKAAAHGAVAIVTKRARAESNTAWAQGGIACVTSSEDSFELHVQDTLEAGAGLCDEAVVRTIVTDGPARIRELIEFGVQFDERELPDGSHELDLGREGGHSQAPHPARARRHRARDRARAARRGRRAPENITCSRTTSPSISSRSRKLGYVSRRPRASASMCSMKPPAKS